MSHVPRVYAFGHGNTSRRTPLIILVFGEFGASVWFVILVETCLFHRREGYLLILNGLIFVCRCFFGFFFVVGLGNFIP